MDLSRDFLCVRTVYKYYLLSYTIFEIWRIIGPIFAVGRGK